MTPIARCTAIPIRIAPTEVVAIRVRAIRCRSETEIEVRRKNKSRSHGPALVADYGATIYIPAGWRCRTDRFGNRVITQ